MFVHAINSDVRSDFGGVSVLERNLLSHKDPLVIILLFQADVLMRFLC